MPSEERPENHAFSNQVFALNLFNHSLVHKAKVRMKRCFPAVAVHGDVIYVVGGVDDSDLNTATEYYDVKKGQGWAWLPTLKVARMVAAGQLWLFEGHNWGGGTRDRGAPSVELLSA